MMTQIEADAVGSDIELRLSDETDNALFRLDTHDDVDGLSSTAS